MACAGYDCNSTRKSKEIFCHPTLPCSSPISTRADLLWIRSSNCHSWVVEGNSSEESQQIGCRIVPDWIRVAGSAYADGWLWNICQHSGIHHILPRKGVPCWDSGELVGVTLIENVLTQWPCLILYWQLSKFCCTASKAETMASEEPFRLTSGLGIYR